MHFFCPEIFQFLGTAIVLAVCFEKLKLPLRKHMDHIPW